jgi:hypothetical protein
MLLRAVLKKNLKIWEHVNFDARKRAEFVKKLHDQARTNIEKMTEIYEN